MINEQTRQIEKKAYEIAYALFRISGNLGRTDGAGHRPLAAYIENHCLSLFDSAIYGNQDSAVREAKILEYYLRLGGDIGIVHTDNIEMLVAEFGKLNAAIAELKQVAGLPDYIKLKFSSPVPLEHVQGKPIADIQKAKEIPAEVINKEIEAIANTDAEEIIAGLPDKTEPVINAEMRQSAILDKIRQSANLSDRQASCRMKDLQEVFPEVSERTLRNDLNRLSDAGLITRVGQGGPSTFYRIAGLTEAQNSPVFAK